MVNETKALADYPGFMGIRRERGLLEGARRVVFFGQIRAKRSSSSAPVEIECAKCGRHGRLRKSIAAGSKLTGRHLAEYPPSIRIGCWLGGPVPANARRVEYAY